MNVAAKIQRKSKILSEIELESWLNNIKSCFTKSCLLGKICLGYHSAKQLLSLLESDDNYVVISALYMALLQKVFNSKNIQVVSAPTIDKIDPRVKVKRIMSAEKFTTVKISLDTPPDSLVTYIGDFCNLSSLATLSISCRKMSQLIRVRPLEPPQGGFSVLKKEAAADSDDYW